MNEVNKIVVDQKCALERCGGDPDLLRELIDMFVATECAKALANLDAAIAARNAKDLRRWAHTLKGSASIFCGKEGESYLAAAVLEKLGQEGTWDGVPAAMARVRVAVAELLPALPTLVQ